MILIFFIAMNILCLLAMHYKVAPDWLCFVIFILICLAVGTSHASTTWVKIEILLNVLGT